MCMSGGRVWELSGRIAPGSTVPGPGTDDSGSVYSDFTPCTECEDQGLESGDTVSSEKRNIIIILDQEWRDKQISLKDWNRWEHDRYR